MKRILMICVILLIALSAGCTNADKSSPEVQDNTYLSDLSPEEILETAFDALKSQTEKPSMPAWNTQMKNMITYTSEMI